MGKGKPRHADVILTVRTPTGNVVEVSLSVADAMVSRYPDTWNGSRVLSRTVTYADGTTRTTKEH